MLGRMKKYQVHGIVGRYWRIREEKREESKRRIHKYLTYLGLRIEYECSGRFRIWKLYFVV